MDDLKRLLEASDHPRRLTPEEDSRIRAQLGLDQTGATDVRPEEGTDPADPVVVDIGVARSIGSQRRGLRRSWPLLASAAAALVLVIALIGTRDRGGDDLVVVDEPTVAATPTVDAATRQLAQTCARALTPLTDDIVAWGGIDLWGAVSIDTATPNLETSLLATLDQFGGLPATDGAAGIADRLRVDLEAAAALVDENRLLVKPARVEAVRSAAGELAVLLANSDAATVCDLVTFEEALDLE